MWFEGLVMASFLGLILCLDFGSVFETFWVSGYLFLSLILN